MGNFSSKNEADEGEGYPNEHDFKFDRFDSSFDEPSPAQPASPNASHSNVVRAYPGASNPLKSALSSFTNNVQLVCMRARDAVSNAIDKIKEIGSGIAKSIGEWTKKYPSETKAIIVFLSVMAITPAVLALMGFTSAGIAAGSTAALIHSGIGNVVAGSAFAICQSAMMGGYGAVIFVAVPALLTAIVYSYDLVCKWWNRGGDIPVGAGGSVGGGGGGHWGGGSGSDEDDGEDDNEDGGSGKANAAVTDETALVRLDSGTTATVQELATDLAQVVQLGTIFVAANVVYRYRRWRQR